MDRLRVSALQQTLKIRSFFSNLQQHLREGRNRTMAPLSWAGLGSSSSLSILQRLRARSSKERDLLATPGTLKAIRKGWSTTSWGSSTKSRVKYKWERGDEVIWIFSANKRLLGTTVRCKKMNEDGYPEDSLKSVPTSCLLGSRDANSFIYCNFV